MDNKKLRLKTLFAIITTIFIASSSGIILAANSDATTSSTEKTFTAVDEYFVLQYSGISRAKGQSARPLLVVDGFKYQLYLKDGSVKTFGGLTNPFNELKAVSHIGPAIYAIALSTWENPADT